MCGISVVVGLESPPRSPEHETWRVRKGALEKQLNASLNMIAHRGPDDRSVWLDERGRVDGCQPFHSPDGTIHVVVNGEIYDHDRIRNELIRDFGYEFQSHSDSEVAVALYKHYGLSFLDWLRGEFAICIFDETQELFVAARDRYGIKPLFWTVLEGRLLVAAEAKAFLPLGWKPEWDVRSLVDAGWLNDTRTIFRNVQRLRPGHYLTCTSFGTIETRQYWDIDYPDKNAIETRSEADMIAGVRQRLLDSVRLRLRADVPVGIYLSGGIDSSAVAGMVTHLVNEQGLRAGSQDAKERVCCFGIAFDKDSGFDESEIAQRTAEWLNVKFIKKQVDEEELAANFEQATYHCEHSNFDLNYVGKFALSEVVRQHGYKVVLTGEGSDEHFAGYPPYKADMAREPDHSWPSSVLADEELRQEVLAMTERANDLGRASLGMNPSEVASPVVKWQLNNTTTATTIGIAQPLDSVFAPWCRSRYGALCPVETVANNIDGRIKARIREKWHPLHAAQYVWIKSFLANNFLTCLGDRSEMAHSVEARTPFLDHKLTEYVNMLPPSLKIRVVQDVDSSQTGGSNKAPNAQEVTLTEKWILREATKPFITEELYLREKHPYSAPRTYPAQGSLHKLFQRLLTQFNIDKLGFLNWQVVETLREQTFSAEESVGRRATALRSTLMAAQWVVLGQKFGIANANPDNNGIPS